jgi:hypothetical protein
MKNTSENKTGKGNKNAQSALAEINAKILELQQQRVNLAAPLKEAYTKMRNDLSGLEGEIKGLDPEWRPHPLKPKAETRITEVISAKGPLTAEEIIKELAGTFTNWKTKSVLKKRSAGPKAIFAVNDGRYSLKAAA